MEHRKTTLAIGAVSADIVSYYGFLVRAVQELAYLYGFDIGFDDVVYPYRVKMEFPVLLDTEAPEIYVYSITSVISEKFEAIVLLGNANSRYKDFYDIYILANSYELDIKGAAQNRFLTASMKLEGNNL